MKTFDEVLEFVLEALMRADPNSVRLNPDTELMEVDDLDSLAFTEVLTVAEEWLQIRIPVDAVTAENMSTPAKMAVTIYALQRDGGES